MWESTVNCLATLDVLIAMATYSRSDMCRPSITFPSLEQGELIDIRSGRHPCVTLAGNEFIPNDVFISSNKVRQSQLYNSCCKMPNYRLNFEMP